MVTFGSKLIAIHGLGQKTRPISRIRRSLALRV